MAIKKMSSQEYNKILYDATNKIEEVSNEMKTIRNDMIKKLMIINHEQEYLSQLYDRTLHSMQQDNTFVFLNNNRYQGLFSGYSSVAHAYFKQTPINVFNLKVVNGKESFFRDEVKVTINGIEDDTFKNILKAEDVADKEIFFEEYEFSSAIKKLDNGTPVEEKSNLLTLVIETDKAKAIGTSKFNIVEIDPYLYKSFNIEALNVYTDDSENPTVTIRNIEKVGKTRFILDKKYDFKKVEFVIRTLYCSTTNGKDVWPFGIKHLFFLEADFRNDSYVIVDYTSDDYIDEVKDSVEVITSTGVRTSSLTEEGINIYLSRSNGMLENLQEPSNDIKKPIARNLNTIYFHIPLKNEPVIGYKFSINKR